MAAAEKIEGPIPFGQPTTASANIYQRINAVMREVRGVDKDSQNPQFKYRYAGHEAVTEAVRASFVKHGIVQTVSMVSCETLDGGVIRAHVKVSWFCADNPASCVVSDSWAVQPSQTREKTLTAQQVGQAMSYAVKNMFFKQLMLIGDPEPDPDSEPVDPPRRRSEPPPAMAQNDVDPGAEILARFGMCQTLEEVAALGNEIRKDWDRWKNIKGFADQMVRARRKANERLKPTRQPGEDDE